MTQAAKAQEPSMEEILSSIRRIIADDDTAKVKVAEAVGSTPVSGASSSGAAPLDPARAGAGQQHRATNSSSVPRAAEDDDLEDVLDLTEAMETPSPNVIGFRTIDGQPDVMFEEAPRMPDPSSAPAASHALAEARRQFAKNTNLDRSILSATTTAAVDSAFNSLAQSVLVQNSQTLEDMVREMLRPMLKSWLDDNLPNLVERLVRAEIERLARGHG